MNAVQLSGCIVRDSELGRTNDGREIVNFDLKVEDRKGRDPIVHCAMFVEDSRDIRKLAAGDRVVLIGFLRHRYDRGGLYITASQLVRVEQCASRNGPGDFPAREQARVGELETEER